MSCFNCGKTEGIGAYSLDLDLPAIVACDMCMLALSMGDEEMLRDLRPRRTVRRHAATHHPRG